MVLISAFFSISRDPPKWIWWYIQGSQYVRIYGFFFRNSQKCTELGIRTSVHDDFNPCTDKCKSVHGNPYIRTFYGDYCIKMAFFLPFFRIFLFFTNFFQQYIFYDKYWVSYNLGLFGEKERELLIITYNNRCNFSIQYFPLLLSE